MTTPLSVSAQLARVEMVLRTHGLWQENAPAPEAWSSDQPFFMNTMEPCEWLQWVLIPRLNEMLEADAPLPDSFAVAPYYEVALVAEHPGREALILELQRLDSLFGGAEDA
ncbi:hypothetical protein TUM12370_08160 [Salmonella enterica subsp. enterica serovar Choleraesuis]|nr:hypothetical protein TUM12370_08160 [Salmonella enterica subsp. enterica serovar Choleraesuis]